MPPEIDVVLSDPSGGGAPASAPEKHAEPGRLAPVVGQGLRRLHDLDPPSLVEHGAGWTDLADECRRRADADLIDPSALPTPYDRYRAEQLLSLLAETRPANEDPVRCHGAATLDRFLIVDGEFAGFTDLTEKADLDRLPIVDRHLDLAVVHLDVHRILGPEAVFALYDGYGRDPDLAALDHYVLMAHLLGRSPITASS